MIPGLIVCTLLIASLLGTLALFWSLKREIWAHARKHRREVSELSKALASAPPVPEPVSVPAPPRSGFNFSKRVQAMRMLRRNQDVSHIAAALGVPRREIELLIRVQQIKPGV